MSTLDNPRQNRMLAFLSALAGAAGVMAGAFGAHLLSGKLAETGHLDTWRTAVLYNLIHAVAVAAISPRDKGCRQAGWFWLVGIGLFSGSLYLLALGAPKWLGPVTPLGGLSLIVGWIWFGVTRFRRDPGGGH